MFRLFCLCVVVVCTGSLIGQPSRVSAQPVEKEETSSEKPAATQEKPQQAKPKLPPRRVPPRRKGEISFDTILFEMDKNADFQRSMITKEIEALNEKTVKIRGFILPASVFQRVGIKQFVLVRDNQECCFGPGAALYDCIIIKMVGDASAKFSTRPVAVKGKFRVTEKYKNPDGSFMAIYEMDATLVE